MNSDAHSNLIFEKRGLCGVYPAAENKKNKSLSLVLLAFDINTHTHTKSPVN